MATVITSINTGFETFSSFILLSVQFFFKPRLISFVFFNLFFIFIIFSDFFLIFFIFLNFILIFLIFLGVPI
ncbi:hypothetical protein EGT73_07120 [Acinetobacter johnsonii]|uniref:Uncharacterized protein n=1 Tax=Acinetobacter johnsonii TaxID=40214 RepID=A0A3R9GNK0_ACIJO|nr:hypothetical protein EGT73_07120 [Acinetobacter johnsonii]